MFDNLLPTAILIPSLNRSHRLESVINNVSARTPLPHRRVFCVGDEKSKLVLHFMGEEYVDDSESEDKRYVTRMNKLVSELKDEQTIFFGSDDVIHHHGWLENALEVMSTDPYPSLVVVNDMRNPNGTQALMRRDYLEQAVFDAPGLAFHPGYLHQFADNEQFATAMAQGEYARAMASCVEHLHPLFKASNSLPDDETYRQAQDWKTWLHDTEMWKTRQVAIAKHFMLEVT